MSDILSHENFVAHLERRCQELMAENQRLRQHIYDMESDRDVFDLRAALEGVTRERDEGIKTMNALDAQLAEVAEAARDPLVQWALEAAVEDYLSRARAAGRGLDSEYEARYQGKAAKLNDLAATLRSAPKEVSNGE